MYRKMNAQVSLAYDFILNRILTYGLAPEALVSDNKLAKELGISRAPVREAILMLVMDGLVQSSPDGKMLVAPISMYDITDIFHIRSALEIEAVRIIASQGWLTDEQYIELQRIHRLFSDTNIQRSLSEHYTYDDLFHSTLSSYSGSRRISQITAQMHLQMQRIRWLSLMTSDRQSEAVKEHSAIIDALIEKDCSKAIDCLQTHFKKSQLSYQSILNDDNTRQVAMTVSTLILNNHNTSNSSDTNR